MQTRTRSSAATVAERAVPLWTRAGESLRRKRNWLQLAKFCLVGASGYAVNLVVFGALLGSGVIIIEGLNLSEAEAGMYEMYCLPLRVAGGDGAPARVLLKR